MKQGRITISGGKVTVGRGSFVNAVKQCEDGDYGWELYEWKDKRSLAQNNLYWAWIDICKDERGYTEDGMHEAFLEAFAPPITIKKLDGTPKQRPMRTSEMNTKQMADYMRQVDREAAENGTILPRPEKELLQWTN